MFWSAREIGLFESAPAFMDWYIRFISHFIRIYESSAPAYAMESAMWSSNPINIEHYVASGYKMRM